MTKPQTIIRLEAENVKRLRAVRITPDGKTVIVGGKNGAGKTSVLDCVAMALGGGKQIPAEPIRRGEHKAQILIETEDFSVIRRFTDKGTTLEIRDRDTGAKLGTPQKMLDSLLGQVSFDPLAFANFDPAKQLAIMRELAGVDTTKLDIKRQALYDQRTNANRDLKSAQARLDKMPSHRDAPESEVSVSQLIAERDRRQQVNAENKHSRDELAAMREEAVVLKREIAEMEKQLEAKRGHLAAVIETGKELAAGAEKLVDQDVGKLTAQIATVEETNRKVRDNQGRVAVQSEVDALTDATTDLSDEIAQIDTEKARLVSEAQFPVDGLSFCDEGILLDGIPFEQASSAQQLKVSVAVGFALNPTFRVLLIRDGSLLDADNLKLVAELADKAGGQLLIERVGDDDNATIVIEDGEVKEGKEKAA